MRIKQIDSFRGIGNEIKPCPQGRGLLRRAGLGVTQSFLAGHFELSGSEDRLSRALRETQDAIRRISTGARMVELSPQNAYIRRQQHQLARSHNLISHSRGKEPRRRVRIYRE